MPWLVWFIAAVALVAGEIFVPGFFLASVGLAAGAAAVASAAGLSATQQVTAFAATAVVSYVAFRPAFEAVFHPAARRIRTNAEGLIGELGRVVVDVGGAADPGRVIVRGDDWRAVSADGESIAEGEAVEVTAISGATLTVSRTSRL